MPLVRITLRKGRSPEQLRGLSAAVHQALVTRASVPPDDLFHVIDEVPDANLIADPTYVGMQRTEGVVFIEITLNAGRTVEVKRALYADIAARLEPLGIRPDDVLINLVEVSKENWSFGRGIATYAQEWGARFRTAQPLSVQAVMAVRGSHLWHHGCCKEPCADSHNNASRTRKNMTPDS